MNVVLGVRYCPATRMTLCVTSEPEMDKCIKMKVNKIIYVNESVSLTFYVIDGIKSSTFGT